MSQPKEKTYKREFAAILVLFWAGMVVWAATDLALLELIKVITAPIFLFVGLAFGSDAYSKQILPRMGL